MAPWYESLVGWGSFGSIHSLYRAVADALDVSPGATLIEFGCGPGTLTPYLLKKVGPGGQVIGVDLADEMIERARRKAEQQGWHNARFERCCVHEYAPGSLVQGAVFSLALSAMPDVPGCLEKALAVLEPGGSLAILDSFPDRSRPWANWIVHLKAPLVGAVPTLLPRQFVAERMQDVRSTTLWGGVYGVLSARKPLTSGSRTAAQ